MTSDKMSYILNSDKSKARENIHCEYLLHLHKTAKHCKLHRILCQYMGGKKSIITWLKPADKLSQRIAISYFSPPYISPTSILVSLFSEIYFMGIYQICSCTTKTLYWDPERLAFTRYHCSSKSKYQICIPCARWGLFFNEFSPSYPTFTI